MSVLYYGQKRFIILLQGRGVRKFAYFPVFRAKLASNVKFPVFGKSKGVGKWEKDVKF